MKLRVMFVGRHRYHLPLNPSLKVKFDALEDAVDLRVLGSTPEGEQPVDNGVFRTVPAFPVPKLDGPWFYMALPLRIARELKGFRPDAVLTQSPYEAASVIAARRLTGSEAKVVLEVHGDWRTLTRLYGSPLRRTVRGLGDAIAAWAIRHADAVRTISGYTSGLVRELGVEPTSVFPAFMDLKPFTEPPERPLPDTPAFLFVGVLERYKNIDGLAGAWRQAAPQLPSVTLTIVGDGTLRDVVQSLVAELPEQTVWKQNLSAVEVSAEMDAASALVLPSRSEGLGRVVVEALSRGRPVLGAGVGGIPDIVHDGENGLLVPPGDEQALAEALVRLGRDPALIERLAGASRESVQPWLASPEEFAERVRNLAQLSLDG